METKNSKTEIFFSNMFSIMILKNEIVATILYVIGYKASKFKEDFDKKLNTDI